MAGAGLHVPRQVEADGQPGEGGQGQIHRIAEDRRARRDGDARPAGEGQSTVAARLNPAAWRRQAHMRRTDGEGRGPILVGEADAHSAPAAADAHHLPQSRVGEGLDRDDRRAGRLGRGAPSSHPALIHYNVT